MRRRGRRGRRLRVSFQFPITMRRCKRRPSLLLLLLLTAILFLCFSGTVRAHATISGFEGFAGGALHPLTIPAHLLIIVALGLLTGQRSPPSLRALFVNFAPILAAALMFTTTGLITGVFQPLLVAVALCAAIPVALEKPVSPLVYRALSAAGALALGFDSAPGASSAGVFIKTLLGTGIMVIFLVFDVAYYTTLAMRRQWSRVGVRVLGSWIIAISLLVLALFLLSPTAVTASRNG